MTESSEGSGSAPPTQPDLVDGAKPSTREGDSSPFRAAGATAARKVEAVALDDSNTAVVGDELRRLLGEDRDAIGERALAPAGTKTVAFNGVRLKIGRDLDNDLVLDDPNVSRFHAEVLATSDGLELRDLGSRNGTRLNGELVDRARIDTGAHIGVGSLQLLFDGNGFLARDDYGSLRLEADGLTVRVRGKQILDRASLSLGPGELVAVIGESGAGKSTLLKALAGVAQPTTGCVRVNDEPLASRLTDVGYVPQVELDHDGLSIHEALTYAARLRLPDDTSDGQIETRVARVLDELSLAEHADTRIGSLSGGQRRRANVAAELLGRPSLLLLDEPTTGMDPWLESKMMRLFRELADHSRGVALVTHATKSLALCDRVIAIGPGGVLTFDGSPADACSFFRVDDYDGIYTALAETPATQWRQRFEESSDGDGAVLPEPREPAGRKKGAGRGRRRVWRQTQVLTSRYAKLTTRDTRNFALLILLPPLLALFGAGLFRPGILDRPSGNPGDAIQALFLAVVAMIFVGIIASVREIIKERGIFEREAVLGVRTSAYLCSKVIVLFGLMVVQTFLYCVVLFTFLPLHGSLGANAEVYALLVMTGFVSIAVGLLVSSAVTTEAQAMTSTPLAVIPALLFAGTIIPVARMAAPAHALAAVTFERWSLAAIGAAVDMNARMAETPGFTQLSHIGTRFFTTAFTTGLLIQAAFVALLLTVTFALLRR